MDGKKSESFTKAFLKTISGKGPLSAAFAALPPSAQEYFPGEAGATAHGRSRTRASRFNPYRRSAGRRGGSAEVAPLPAPFVLPNATAPATRPLDLSNGRCAAGKAPPCAEPSGTVAAHASPSTLAAARGPHIGLAASHGARLPHAAASFADVDSLGRLPDVAEAAPVGLATSSSTAYAGACSSAGGRIPDLAGHGAPAAAVAAATTGTHGAITFLSSAVPALSAGGATQRGIAVGGSGGGEGWPAAARPGSLRRGSVTSAGSTLLKWLKSSFRGNKAEATRPRVPFRDVQNVPAAAAAAGRGCAGGPTDVNVLLSSETQQCDESPFSLSTFSRRTAPAYATKGKCRSSTCSDDQCCSFVSDSVMTCCSSPPRPGSTVDVPMACGSCMEQPAQHQPEQVLLLSGNRFLCSGNDASEARSCRQLDGRSSDFYDCISTGLSTSNLSCTVDDDIQQQGSVTSADVITHPWQALSLGAASLHITSLHTSEAVAAAVDCAFKDLACVSDVQLVADKQFLAQPASNEQHSESIAGIPASAAVPTNGRLFASMMKEFMNAERTYVRHLDDVIAGYKDPCEQHQDLFSKSDVMQLFGNIAELCCFSHQLLASLEDCVRGAQGLGAVGEADAISTHDLCNDVITEPDSGPTVLKSERSRREDQATTDLVTIAAASRQLCCTFARCFLDRSEGFLVYSDYCNNYDRAAYLYSSLICEARYQRFFEGCRLLRGMDKIPLNGFLLTPVQKICKYHLQLAELMNSSSCGSAEPGTHSTAPGRCPTLASALAVMRDVVHRVNDQKRVSDSRRSVDEWQVKVMNWKGENVSRLSSRLILSGEHVREEWLPVEKGSWFKRVSRQRRWYYLFSAELVECQKIATSQRNGKQLSLCRRYRLASSTPVIETAMEEDTTTDHHDSDCTRWELVDANTAATLSAGSGDASSSRHGLLPIRSQQQPQHALLLRPAGQQQMAMTTNCGNASLTILSMKTAADKAAWLKAVQSGSYS